MNLKRKQMGHIGRDGPGSDDLPLIDFRKLIGRLLCKLGFHRLDDSVVNEKVAITTILPIEKYMLYILSALDTEGADAYFYIR